MFRLTREVRFAINAAADDQLSAAPTNSYGGYPSLSGFGQYFAVRITLAGALDPASGYLRNIKQIDQAVRQRIIAAGNMSLSPAMLFEKLQPAFGDALHALTLCLSPFLTTTQLASEIGMYTRLSQKFEFSASHRLHNPALTDEENRRVYGKCNNPSGHGHNYEVQVTLRGNPNGNGLLVDIPDFERLVQRAVIDRLDHKNLNIDVPEFRELIPTVENISMVIHRMLKSPLEALGAELASVTVWETPKTWSEYTEL